MGGGRAAQKNKNLVLENEYERNWNWIKMTPITRIKLFLKRWENKFMSRILSFSGNPVSVFHLLCVILLPFFLILHSVFLYPAPWDSHFRSVPSAYKTQMFWFGRVMYPFCTGVTMQGASITHWWACITCLALCLSTAHMNCYSSQLESALALVLADHGGL